MTIKIECGGNPAKGDPIYLFKNNRGEYRFTTQKRFNHTLVGRALNSRKTDDLIEVELIERYIQTYLADGTEITIFVGAKLC